MRYTLVSNLHRMFHVESIGSSLGVQRLALELMLTPENQADAMHDSPCR